jgi:hypothetical protein
VRRNGQNGFEGLPQEPELAAANWLFDVLQIPEMLPPAPRKSAADAKATNAMRRVYSMRSWPSSSAKQDNRVFFISCIYDITAF